MAAMANRKKGDYSVLSEINTEEEWLTLLERKVSIFASFIGCATSFSSVIYF